MGKKNESKPKIKFTVVLTAEEVFALKSAVESFTDRETPYQKLVDAADSAFSKLPDSGMKWQDFA